MKSMKSVTVGLVLLLGFVALFSMYKISEAEMGAKAQQASVAMQTRPNDLMLLKRDAVRIACTKHIDWDMESCRTIDQQRVSIGMTAEQAQLSWGKPKAVNTTMTTDVAHEQWVYGGEYLYVDNGILRSMQTSRMAPQFSINLHL
jgi:hypothetical protein